MWLINCIHLINKLKILNIKINIMSKRLVYFVHINYIYLFYFHQIRKPNSALILSEMNFLKSQENNFEVT